MKLLFLFIFSSFISHNYHVSDTLIYKNDETNTFEITVKVFADDIEHLKEIKKKNSGSEDFIFDVEKYVSDNLQITANDQILFLEPIGNEQEFDRVYCYYEIHNLPVIFTMEVQNTILFDLFDDQANVVDVVFAGSKKRVLLSKEKDTERVFGE